MIQSFVTGLIMTTHTIMTCFCFIDIIVLGWVLYLKCKIYAKWKKTNNTSTLIQINWALQTHSGKPFIYAPYNFLSFSILYELKCQHLQSDRSYAHKVRLWKYQKACPVASLSHPKEIPTIDSFVLYCFLKWLSKNTKYLTAISKRHHLFNLLLWCQFICQSFNL